MHGISNNRYFPSMRRVQQVTSSHCGPATLEMLASFCGLNITQRQFEAALGIGRHLYTHGNTIDQMGEVCEKVLPPHLHFWYKHESSLIELEQLVEEEHQPIGIEWQGVFEEDADDDDGHYSVVTHLSLDEDLILISDPYGRYAGTDRIFRAGFFEQRWWDTNEVFDPQIGRERKVRDFHSLFVIAPDSLTFPQRYSLTRF
jgi:hypothetical protein